MPRPEPKPEQMIGTKATDTERAIWPELDHEGREYKRAGISTVSLGGGQFAVVAAGRNIDQARINELKRHVAQADFDAASQSFKLELNPSLSTASLMTYSRDPELPTVDTDGITTPTQQDPNPDDISSTNLQAGDSSPKKRRGN